MIGPGIKLVLAVKGNAYGLGAAAVGSMVESEGLADWFAVATVPEGIRLRYAGLHLPILKLSPAFPDEMEAAVENKVTLAVCDKSNILALQGICAKKRMNACVHLKVDTGLGRIGIAAQDAAELALFTEKNCPNIHLEGVFSHMAVSDLSKGASFTEEQIMLFKKTTDEIATALGRVPEWLHCGNSGVILRHKKGLFNMVRSGQVPYGWLDYVQDSVKLYPTLSFLTRISYLKRVKMGQRIGYGLTWAAPEDTWVGTLPVGYGDGLNRRFSNRGHVLVNGKSYPIVGMMAMDQSMINLGPNAQAKVGDEVVLMGRSGDLEITLQEFATALDTVPWEITSLISPRVDRVYMDSSGQSQKYLWEPLPRVLASV
jgi:alanine racemase